MTYRRQSLRSAFVTSVVVSIVAVVVALVPTPFGRAASAATVAVRLPTGEGCQPEAQVRPRTIMLSCADGNAYIGSITWTSWGSMTAWGTGVVMRNPCVPSCVADSIVPDGAVSLEASMTSSGDHLYTRLIATRSEDHAFWVVTWSTNSLGATTLGSWSSRTNGFVSALTKPLILDTRSTTIGGVALISGTPTSFIDLPQERIVLGLESRLGAPDIFSSTLCTPELRVTVVQWHDLSVAFAHDRFVLLAYDAQGWSGAQRVHPAPPSSSSTTLPPVRTDFGGVLGQSGAQLTNRDPKLHGSATSLLIAGGFTELIMSHRANAAGAGPSDYVASEFQVAGGNC